MAKFYFILLTFTLANLTTSWSAEVNSNEVETGESVEESIPAAGELKAKTLETTHRLMKEGCLCYFLYAPICAANGETYANECFLECAQKQDPFLLGLCHGDCPCCKKPYRNKPPQISDFGIPPGWGWGDTQTLPLNEDFPSYRTPYIGRPRPKRIPNANV